MDFWKHIQNEISQATGRTFLLSKRIPVSGGDINQALHLSGSNSEYFIKINTSDYHDMFIKESQGLNELEKTNTLIIPKVVADGIFEQQSYLILEYLKINPHGDIKTFARALAKLHLSSHHQFGFFSDNYIGRTPQVNRWEKNWGTFFSEKRIGYQLDLLSQKGISANIIYKGKQLVQKLPELLNQHKPKPALVHGDLWQGNYGFHYNGKPMVFDPACYYADHEVDLAMLELFGNPGAEFFEAYFERYKISKGYSSRKKVYNLYHILNHANLFAGSYIKQSEQMIDEILNGF